MTNRREILKGLGVLGLGGLVGPSGLSVADDCSVGPSTAIFYAQPVPTELFERYQRLIVEADAITDEQISETSRAELFLYVSVGEAEPWRSGYEALDPAWFLGRNAGWGGNIVDLTQAGWLQYLIEGRIGPLWSRGYRGFFLDTLDSFRALELDPVELAAQEAGLREILRGLFSAFPGIGLIFNRGFDLLPDFGEAAVGLVAESLFYGWDSVEKSYFRRSLQDQAWLLPKLEAARDTYGLAVTVIDYVPPTNRALRYRTAGMIRDLGFTPWVTTPLLDSVGIGSVDLPCP